MTQLLLVALAAATFTAADTTGTWTGTLTPSGGDGQSHPAHIVLKQEGTMLTGTAGPDTQEQRPIQNGKTENGTVMFEVQNDNSVMTFVLKQDGDVMTGDVTRERDGQKQTATLSVKRSK